MTHRERFVTALEGGQADYVPTFELVHFLSMELLGKVHPTHRSIAKWDQMSAKEKRLQIDDIAAVYVETARHHEHSAIFIHAVQGIPDSIERIAEGIRTMTGDEYFLMCHGDSTMSVPSGERIQEVCFSLVDDPRGIKASQEEAKERRLEYAARIRGRGILDGFALCADYCFNTNPFLSPGQFSEFVAPFLGALIAGYRELGYYSIKHTDGNIMPILDQIVACRPHALHSLDPQAGVDIAEVKRLYGREICLIGNVNCGLLQTGTEEEVIESATYAMTCGKPGGGYVFSTSNCVYTGLPLERYDLMLEVWRRLRQY